MVRGDVRDIVLPACLAVGRPIVFSVAIMVLSFLPVFALGGIEGKMFHPLAYTKTFALGAVAVLAVTLVPALCTVFIRGKLRSELENPLIRGVIEVYRPVLSYMMDRPAALAWVLGVTFLLGFIPLGSRPVTLAILFVAMVSTALLARRWVWAVVLPASLVMVALVADQTMTPLEREFMAPLDEGMVMDMPITVPRASVTESVDDLKARDMVLCRFPEVDMVVGKAGRAETATDPAPMDMIETMVNFRPRELWPRRKLGVADARRQGRAVYDALVTRDVIGQPELGGRAGRAHRAVGGGRARSLRRRQPRVCLPSIPGNAARDGGDLAFLDEPILERGSAVCRSPGSATSRRSTDELLARAAPQFTRLVMEQLLDRGKIVNPDVAAYRKEAARVRAGGVAAAKSHMQSTGGGRPSSRGRRPDRPRRPLLEPQPILDAISRTRSRSNSAAGSCSGRPIAASWRRSAASSTWPFRCRAGPTSGRCRSRIGSTCFRPGVNTPIGIRVLGRNLDDVIRGSEEVARVVKPLRGAVDVVADPDSRQTLYRNPHRSSARRRARRERGRDQRRDRDRARRQGGRQRRSKGANGIRSSSGAAGAGATMRNRSETSR